MPSDSTLIAVAAISAGASGTFALLGVATTNWLTAKRERRAFRVETAMMLADTERLTWGESFQELSTHLQRLDARLAVVGVPEDLVETYPSVCRQCFRDNRATLERSGGEHTGMDANLLDSQHALHRAIQAHLLRRGSARARAQLRADAMAQAPPSDSRRR
jgi:hypothetical protein